MQMAVKIPLNGDVFFSTGSVDVGAQLAAQLIRGRHAFYASGALVYYSGSGTPFHDPSTVVPTGIVGYEYRWYPSTHLIAQLYASRSVYGAAMTDLDELRQTKHQVSVRVRQRLERGYLSFAVTENVINFNNSPDIGFQVGLGWAASSDDARRRRMNRLDLPMNASAGVRRLAGRLLDITGLPRRAALLGALLLAGCSTFQPWQNLPVRGGAVGQRTSQAVERPIVAVVTLSGGGARAAAFGLGVLRELKATAFTLQGKPTTLLDEVALISGVSGGSVLAAHYAAFGDESLTRFESEFLLKDFEGGLIQLALSPLRLYRLSSPWYGRSNVLAERLEALYRGRTFGDLLARPRGPDLLVTATDLTTGATFEFTPEQFALICADLASMPLSFAVAASSAVPLVLTPMTLRNYAGQCRVPHENAVPKAVDNNYRARLFRASEESYLNAEERPYIHLVDGGLADNLGIRAILDRLIAHGSFSASFRAAAPGSIRKIVLIAVNSERDLGERIDHSDRVPTTRQVVDTLLFGAGARITQTTLEMMRDDMQRWRGEVAERRGMPGSPFAADAELHVVSVSLHDVEDPAVRHSVLTIPTAFTIDPKEVHQLVEAGRQALRRSPEFQRLHRRLADKMVERGAPACAALPCIKGGSSTSVDTSHRRSK